MVVWLPTPQFKLEIGTTPVTWTNDQAMSVIVTRPENAVSNAVLIANDYQSRNYLTNINNLDTLKVYFRYGINDWTLVHYGEVESIQPQLNVQGEVLAATSRGRGWPLLDMHVCKAYGTESANPTIDTVVEIITDIEDNYYDLSFGGGASGHTALTVLADTAATWNASLTYVPFPYKTCFEALRTLCDIGTSYAAGAAAGPHFMVTEAAAPKLCVATVGSHVAAFNTDWPTYWNTDAAGSTFTEGVDFVNYSFQDDVKNYFNHIVYAGTLLKPGDADSWTENHHAWWGEGAHTTCSDVNAAGYYKVGSYSLKGITDHVNDLLEFWYPSSGAAAWNISNWGGRTSIPTIQFWIMGASISNVQLALDTDSSNYYYRPAFTVDATWRHYVFNIGPYCNLAKDDIPWLQVGNPSWGEINDVWFFGTAGAGAVGELWVDGLNFQGQVIRCATDSTKITANEERQRYIFDSVGKDDVGRAGTPGTTDLGFMARIAKAELFRCAKKPKVGSFTTPLNPTVLPGQLCHVHAGRKADGTTFNFDADYRITEVKHSITATQGALTTYTVTNDVINGIVNRPYSMANMVVQQLLGKDKDTLNLRSMDIDITTPRLTENYAT